MGAVFRWVKYIYEWCKDFAVGGLGYPAEYYVSKDGNDDNNGLSWSKAFLTIQAGLDAVGALGLTKRGVVNVAPGSYTESLNTPLDTVARYGKLIGAGLTEKGEDVQITSAAVDVATITVRARGWRISKLTINCPAEEAGIKLDYASENCIPDYSEIDHCHIMGGLRGIDAFGSATHAPARIKISYNQFDWILGPTDVEGIAIGSSAGINCNVWEIKHNTFQVNGNHILFIAAQAPQSFTIRHNVFHSQFSINRINLSANSVWNIITQNFLGGEYSNAGGYLAGAVNNQWYGNFADVVGGITQADPA